jgi:hypothetical protein
VRVRLVATLATAREPFHVDVNVGDPIWPGPVEVSLPRLLEADPIHLRGYPMEMVLADKGSVFIRRQAQAMIARTPRFRRRELYWFCFTVPDLSPRPAAPGHLRDHPGYRHGSL